jgi:erythromycin esterase
MTPTYATLDYWIAREAISFSVDSPDVAIDKVIASLDDSVELLGFGEALHGGEEILMLRNRLFQRLVEKHGYRAIAIESTFPQARHVNEYITTGQGTANFNDWISNGMGLLDANRELIEWMRQYNSTRADKLHFYGFDMPLGKFAFGSPRLVLTPVLDFLPGNDERRQRIETLIGPDSDWENMAVIADPSKSVGLTPRATELRIEVENLITELRTHQPEFDKARYAEALHNAQVARQLLNAHAAMARKAGYAEVLGIRDAIMADNLAYIVSRERSRGKVLVFAHNSHLKRRQATWQMGPVTHAWWPAGSHIGEMFGSRYAVIGTAVGVSEQNGIATPEPGTLEARLTALPRSERGEPGPALFIPTHRGQDLPAAEAESARRRELSAAIAALPIRTGSTLNPTYFALTPQSLTDFDWLAFLDSTTYQRGGPPLKAWDANPKK